MACSSIFVILFAGKGTGKPTLIGTSTMLNTYNDFRQFYNQVLFPELKNLERQRRQVLRFLFLTTLLLLLLLGVVLYLQIFVITLLMVLVVGYAVALAYFKVETYVQNFKPRILRLILDFVDNSVHFNQLQYFPKEKVPMDDFLASRLFPRADEYQGEDKITGKVRETPFQLSELRVAEFSAVRNQLDPVFRGIFLQASYQNPAMKGSLLVLPDQRKKFLHRTERGFHLMGGRKKTGFSIPELETWYDLYCTPDFPFETAFPAEFQQLLLDFRLRNQADGQKREVYLSLIGSQLYLAIEQERNLFEPSLWSPTVDFARANAFHEDIQLLLQLILQLDVLN